MGPPNSRHHTLLSFSSQPILDPKIFSTKKRLILGVKIESFAFLRSSMENSGAGGEVNREAAESSPRLESQVRMLDLI